MDHMNVYAIHNIMIQHIRLNLLLNKTLQIIIIQNTHTIKCETCRHMINIYMRLYVVTWLTHIIANLVLPISTHSGISLYFSYSLDYAPVNKMLLNTCTSIQISLHHLFIISVCAVADFSGEIAIGWVIIMSTYNHNIMQSRR